MKNFSTVLASLLLATIALQTLTAPMSHADESAFAIGLGAEQKTAIFKAFRERLAQHQHMTFAEIINDLTQSAEKNRALYAQSGKVDMPAYEKAVSQSIDELKKIGDKDALIALETAQLQSAMSSSNLLFAFTRLSYENGLPFEACGANGSKGHCAVQIVATPVVFLFLVTIDLVFFPIELMASIVGGF